MTISIHTLPEPGKGTILALRTWNTLLLLAVRGHNYENKQTNKISRKIFKQAKSKKIIALFKRTFADSVSKLGGCVALGGSVAEWFRVLDL